MRVADGRRQPSACEAALRRPADQLSVQKQAFSCASAGKRASGDGRLELVLVSKSDVGQIKRMRSNWVRAAGEGDHEGTESAAAGCAVLHVCDVLL